MSRPELARPSPNEVLERSIAWGAGAGAGLGFAVIYLAMLFGMDQHPFQALEGLAGLGWLAAIFGAAVGAAEGLATGLVLAFSVGWISADRVRAAGASAAGSAVVPVLICLCARSLPVTEWCLAFSVVAGVVAAVLGPQIACPQAGRAATSMRRPADVCFDEEVFMSRETTPRASGSGGTI